MIRQRDERVWHELLEALDRYGMSALDMLEDGLDESGYEVLARSAHGERVVLPDGSNMKIRKRWPSDRVRDEILEIHSRLWVRPPLADAALAAALLRVRPLLRPYLDAPRPALEVETQRDRDIYNAIAHLDEALGDAARVLS